jgi:deoxyribodipyrimidine photolyase
MKRSKKAIIWFRWDLRIEDKEALFKASILAE